MHSYFPASNVCGSHDEGKGLTRLSPASVCLLCASKDGRLGSHLQRSSPSGLAFTMLSRTRPSSLLAPASVFAPLRERCLVVVPSACCKACRNAEAVYPLSLRAVNCSDTLFNRSDSTPCASPAVTGPVLLQQAQQRWSPQLWLAACARLAPAPHKA